MSSVVAAVIVLAAAPSVFGWENGPDCGRGLGTHDWVLTEAMRRAGNPKWLQASVALTASDDPDTIRRDFYYHAYDVWGARYGDSPKMAPPRFPVLGLRTSSSSEICRLASSE